MAAQNSPNAQNSSTLMTFIDLHRLLSFSNSELRFLLKLRLCISVGIGHGHCEYSKCILKGLQFYCSQIVSSKKAKDDIYNPTYFAKTMICPLVLFSLPCLTSHTPIPIRPHPTAAELNKYCWEFHWNNNICDTQTNMKMCNYAAKEHIPHTLILFQTFKGQNMELGWRK